MILFYRSRRNPIFLLKIITLGTLLGLALFLVILRDLDTNGPLDNTIMDLDNDIIVYTEPFRNNESEQSTSSSSTIIIEGHENEILNRENHKTELPAAPATTTINYNKNASLNSKFAADRLRFQEDLTGNSSWKRSLFTRCKSPPIAGWRNDNAGEKKWVVIGISTVWRKENYIFKTLNGLIQKSTIEEKNYALIVIYLADTDPIKRVAQLKIIQDNFSGELKSGFLQVIQSESADIYPPMDFANFKRTFNDPKERVLWRTKQVIDFVFLFSYAESLAHHYLVLEDDVLPSDNYLLAIREFSESRNISDWTALRFTEFLGIGLLFHTQDLPKMVQFILLFYQNLPVDMLMAEFMTLQAQDSEFKSRKIPSIFQHIGTKSTLKGKLQKLKDPTFGVADRRFIVKNPPAKIMTSMKIYSEFVPENVYSRAPGYFWGISKPEDTFDIILDSPQKVSQIVVVSGLTDLKKETKGKRVVKKYKILKDLIEDGQLLVSSKFQSIHPYFKVATCQDWRLIGQFSKPSQGPEFDLKNGGIFKVSLNHPGGPDGGDNDELVQCVRIKIGPKQTSWTIIREIAIIT